MKKYIVSISEDNNKTIVTRYLKENFLMKSKFFILLYSIYLIYVRVYIYKFNLDISLMKKVSLETSFHFLVLYFIILLVKSKEIMILEKEEITIKKFFTFICYQTNKIKVSDIKSIYYETNSLTGKFNIFVDMTKNLKIRTKFKEFEDKIYYFGINLSEEEYKEIAGKILNCTDKINVLFIEWRKNTIRWFMMLNNKEKLIELIELIEFGDEIKEIINLWDPMGLMDFCPEDEYETEVKGIRNLVVNNKNIDKKTLAQEIKNIFEYYFSNEYKSKQEIEEDIASKIIEKSKEYKLNFILPNYYDTKKIIFKNQKEVDIYINLYIKINKIINLWDPLKIMDVSFSNEYSYEINRIIEELSKNISVQDLAEKINKIFKNSYNELYEIEKNEEIKIARKILEVYNIGEVRGIW